MAGEQRLLAGGKLRLKRKRTPEQPPEPGQGAPLPLRLPTEENSPGWFEAQDLREADQTWLALLQATDPQMTRSTLGKVAKFPEFLNKSSQITNPPPEPETFNIGLERFQWEPFPLYRRAFDTIDHEVPQENPTTITAERETNEDERFDTISPIPGQASLVAKGHTPKRSKTGQGTGRSSKDCGKKIKNSPHGHRQNSPRSFAPAAVQQKLGLPDLWKKASTQSQQKSMRGSEKERAINKDTLTQSWTARLLPSQGSPADSSVSSLERKPVCQNEDISTLDCCPMCQFRFTGTLSQMDRDSHLAKCLAESTEDVIW